MLANYFSCVLLRIIVDFGNAKYYNAIFAGGRGCTIKLTAIQLTDSQTVVVVSVFTKNEKGG